ncbi:uncharacterized protein VP01_1805g6 [Puccinia sorghi]|uniref:SNF2 N-terminal domain-containing protein n=1 Tax=Puccinia sorghi TaxID=27349 RepID=A0A0L6VG39_9BASI|nr:uncharacterized protein VP01_1805g6 [Puccinia sorghi]
MLGNSTLYASRWGRKFCVGNHDLWLPHEALETPTGSTGFHSTVIITRIDDIGLILGFLSMQVAPNLIQQCDCQRENQEGDHSTHQRIHFGRRYGIGKDINFPGPDHQFKECNQKVSECGQVACKGKQLDSNLTKIIVYNGEEREELTIKALWTSDIILVTYNTVSANYESDCNVLFQATWFCIILDKAPLIHDASTKQSKAILNLQSQCCLCLTGKPFQNHLSEIYTLLHFIRLDPWARDEVWQAYIKPNICHKSPKAIEMLQQLVSTVSLRRLNSVKFDLYSVGVALIAEGITFEQMDGSYLLEAREKSLALIRQDPNTRVLLAIIAQHPRSPAGIQVTHIVHYLTQGSIEENIMEVRLTNRCINS